MTGVDRVSRVRRASWYQGGGVVGQEEGQEGRAERTSPQRADNKAFYPKTKIDNVYRISARRERNFQKLTTQQNNLHIEVRAWSITVSIG